MSEAQSVQDIEQHIQATQQNRTIYWFKIPQKIFEKSGIKKIGLVELQAHEEMMCTDRAAQNPTQLGFELAKESLRRADDKALTTGDGTLDMFWGSALPGYSKVRQLALAAYGHIHTPNEEEAESFLGSMETQIG